MKKNKILVFIVVFLGVVLIGLGVGIYFKYNDGSKNTSKGIDNKDNNKNSETTKNSVSSLVLKESYTMNGNDIEDFDLVFLQLENNKKNTVYSPLSIKYALEMLAEGANGNTKTQLNDVIGKYEARKYNNSNNISFANALFVRDSFKNNIKEDYISKLQNKYNASVVFDDFSTTKNVNSWVNDKTFNLINNAFDDLSSKDFVLMNALAIDMEWVNRIEPLSGDKVTNYNSYDGLGTNNYGYYHVTFDHLIDSENEYSIGVGVGPLNTNDYTQINFNTSDNKEKAEFTYGYSEENKYSSVHIAAIADKYNIVEIEGEENIRKTITDEYNSLDENSSLYVKPEEVEGSVNSYIEQLNRDYQHVSSSTDFEFYVDDEVQVFAKDLKQYDGVQLQYIGIMPKKDTLKDYISNIDAAKVSTIISNLKDISLDSFDDNYITIINGYIPMFNFDYELDLLNDLNKLGIVDVFNQEKVDLSNLSNQKGTYINEVAHKATIDFSNEGIKASALTIAGGLGDLTLDIYKYKVPVKHIDLTFNNPYMYLIRNKSTGEVWFAGSVYEPTLYTETPSGE